MSSSIITQMIAFTTIGCKKTQHICIAKINNVVLSYNVVATTLYSISELLSKMNIFMILQAPSPCIGNLAMSIYAMFSTDGKPIFRFQLNKSFHLVRSHGYLVILLHRGLKWLLIILSPLCSKYPFVLCRSFPPHVDSCQKNMHTSHFGLPKFFLPRYEVCLAAGAQTRT